MLKYLSADIICSNKRTVFQEGSLRKTVSFEEQIMYSNDKIISKHIFAPNGGYCIILQIFFPTRTVLKIREYSWIFPSFSWGIFGHVKCFKTNHVQVKIFDGLYSGQ